MLDLCSMSANADLGDIIRIEEVLTITGLRRTMLYELIREGTFPCQVELGARAVGWYRDKVMEWKRNRPSKQPRGRGLINEAVKRKVAEASSSPVPADVSKKPKMSLTQANPEFSRGATLIEGKTESSVTSAREVDQFEFLRAENIRLKELLADLVIRNDKLQSDARNISMGS